MSFMDAEQGDADLLVQSGGQSYLVARQVRDRRSDRKNTRYRAIPRHGRFSAVRRPAKILCNGKHRDVIVTIKNDKTDVAAIKEG
ncbi:MAG: hypothetical protein JOZ19_08085 [Rubrobacter sp.]|nr:hypothetical protein [Rubrobacter sp.]